MIQTICHRNLQKLVNYYSAKELGAHWNYPFMQSKEISTHLSNDMTKPTKWLYAQRRLRSAWASAQSDQSFCCHMKKSGVLSYPLSAQQRLIKWGGCPGWSESSLGAHSLLLSCCVSSHYSKPNSLCSVCWLQLGLVTRKPVFEVSDQGWLNPACAATEAR